MWILHRRNIAIITQESPSQMRKYLTAARDYAYLRTWDNQKLSDKFSDKNQQ